MKTQNLVKIAKIVLFCSTISASAQNPLIRNQYSADPSARVFGDRVYVYPSHDIIDAENKSKRKEWFCMEDYHVFSSDNLTEWTDHGSIIQQNKVPWVLPESYSMWAPDCVERNGKYYFYFPSVPKDTVSDGKGFRVGVAISNSPYKDFVPQPEPIKGVKGIDPNVFIDKDGQAYLYWSARDIFGAKLKENMVELDSEVKTLGDLPSKGLKEGPYVFERNGIYYMTYPHVENKIERLEYAISDNPLGPFKVMGVIMDESPTGCWTNHHSILQFKNQWYLFYHHNDYSPTFDKARSIRADVLSFNPDGTIIKVIPTLRGIGTSLATNKIELDRYSKISDSGVSIDFLDPKNTFLGWKTIFTAKDAKVQYDQVDFGKKSLKKVLVKAFSEAGGILQIKSNDGKNSLLAEIKIPKSNNWQEITIPVIKKTTGIQNLEIQSQSNNSVAIDWIRFE